MAVVKDVVNYQPDDSHQPRKQRHNEYLNEYLNHGFLLSSIDQSSAKQYPASRMPNVKRAQLCRR
jgi:hypothetical protein